MMWEPRREFIEQNALAVAKSRYLIGDKALSGLHCLAAKALTRAALPDQISGSIGASALGKSRLARLR